MLLLRKIAYSLLMLPFAAGMPTAAFAAASGWVIVEAKSAEAAKLAAIKSRRLRNAYGEGFPIVVRSNQGDRYMVSINGNARCIRIISVQPAEGGKWRVELVGSSGTNKCP